MIEVKDVTKRFEDTLALDGLTMTVPKGAIYGLMGLNGAGKTTIIKHLAGYLEEDEGEITIDGQPVELARADYVLRTLYVPAGSHTIQMTFDPQSIHVTETIAYGALILLLLATLAALGIYIKKNH